VAISLGVSPDNVTSRIRKVLQDKKDLEALLSSHMTGGETPGESIVKSQEYRVEDREFCYKAVTVKAADNTGVREWGDAFLASGVSGVATVGAEFPGTKYALFIFVTKDVVDMGIKANELVSRIAEKVGGRGGGRVHMAQAGVKGPSEMEFGLGYGQQVFESSMGELNIKFSMSPVKEKE